MPLQRFIEPEVGDVVFISSGFETTDGTISDIYPISTSLGADRRDFFTTTPLGQTARVNNGGFDQLLPIDSQVVVRMNYSTALTRFVQLFSPIIPK